MKNNLYSCNNKRVVYGAVVQHIIGEGHCRRVAKIYKDKESITYSKQKNDDQEEDAVEKNDLEFDEALGDGETDQVKVPALPDTDDLLNDVAAGGKVSAAKRKTPNNKVAKKKKARNGNSQNALTVEGGLVVNGLDIVKYIRGLEVRISDLERQLAAASSASAPVV